MASVAAGAEELLSRATSGRDPETAAVAPSGTGPGGALTERERAALRPVAQGRTNREIAERLRISPHTAANHVRAILQKTVSAES